MGADLSGGGLYEAITGEPVSELIQHTNTGDILPATDSLIGSDGEFTGKLELLKDALAQVNYDHVIIDTPPALCAITLLAIVASSDLIIPLEPCLYSIQGFEQLYYYLNRIKDHTGYSPKIDGLLFTRYDPRMIVPRQMREALTERAAELGVDVFKTTIKTAAAVRKAQAKGAGILELYPDSQAAEDYKAFTKEYLKK